MHPESLMFSYRVATVFQDPLLSLEHKVFCKEDHWRDEECGLTGLGSKTLFPKKLKSQLAIAVCSGLSRAARHFFPSNLVSVNPPPKRLIFKPPGIDKFDFTPKPQKLDSAPSSSSNSLPRTPTRRRPCSPSASP